MKKLKYGELLSLINKSAFNTKQISLSCEDKTGCLTSCSLKTNGYRVYNLLEHLNITNGYSSYFTESFLEGKKIYFNFKCSNFGPTHFVKIYVDADMVKQYQLSLFKGDE